MKKRALIAMGVLAIAVGTAGIVLAGAAAPPKTAKACVNAHGVLKLVQDGSCGSGTRITLVGKRYQGVAKAYAHIKSDGTVDAGRSWNIASSNVVTTNDGFWCFRNLGFTPQSAQITFDYNGILNGQIPQGTVILPADASDCGLASAQLEVFTGLVDPGVFTSGEKLAFYIVIY
jgi:hypothetical protein